MFKLPEFDYENQVYALPLHQQWLNNHLFSFGSDSAGSRCRTMLSMLTMPKVQASASETIECLNFLVLHAEFEISYTSQEDGKCLSRNGKI